MITIGYPIGRGAQYDPITRHHGSNVWLVRPSREWFHAIKRTERNLLALGFSSADAWRLAFGER